jgi:hypothetical protein
LIRYINLIWLADKKKTLEMQGYRGIGVSKDWV